MVVEKKYVAIMTIDDVINKVGGRPNLLLFLIATWAMCCNVASALNAYMIQFTGFIPWDPITCLSDNCTRHINQPSGKIQFD